MQLGAAPSETWTAEAASSVGSLSHLFVVDQWTQTSSAYFLTHLHADHTRGLSGSWCRGPIYCSPVTAALVPLKFPGLCRTLLHPLELGVCTLLKLPLRHGGATLLEVTAIDACHCPGSVMYVIKGCKAGRPFCVVHTGDFRWDECVGFAGVLPTPREQLQAAIGSTTVDCLYLDNTYCHPRYHFPSRAEATNQIVAQAEAHPDCDVVLGLDSLGKEELLLALAEALGSKVAVSAQRVAAAQVLSLSNAFVDLDILRPNEQRPRIRTVPRKALTGTLLQKLGAERPCIGVLPTGWACLHTSKHAGNPAATVCQNVVEDASLAPGFGEVPHGTGLSRATSSGAQEMGRDKELQLGNGSGRVHWVAYSLHSSFSELRSFVALVQPHRVAGIVPALAAGTGSTCPAAHFQGLCRPPAAVPLESRPPDLVLQQAAGLLSRMSSILAPAGLAIPPPAPDREAGLLLPLGIKRGLLPDLWRWRRPSYLFPFRSSAREADDGALAEGVVPPDEGTDAAQAGEDPACRGEEPTRRKRCFAVGRLKRRRTRGTEIAVECTEVALTTEVSTPAAPIEQLAKEQVRRTSGVDGSTPRGSTGLPGWYAEARARWGLMQQ